MGLVLSIETGTGKEVPYLLSDALRHHFLAFGTRDEPLAMIAERFSINLDSLTGDCIVGREDETKEQFMSRDPGNKKRELYWHESQVKREMAWQQPQTIIDTINSLISILDTQPTIFSGTQIETQDFKYFTEGFFREDLLIMKKALQWCVENKINKVRLTIG